MQKMTIKKDRKFEEIFEKAINSSSLKRVLAGIRKKIALGTKFSIFTPNPEIVLKSQKDEEFLRILLKGDILIPDAVGLWAADEFLKKEKCKSFLLKPFLYLWQGILVGWGVLFSKGKKVIKGRKLFMELLKLGNSLGWKVYLLGGEKGQAVKAMEKLKLNFKKIDIKAQPGPTVDFRGDPVNLKEKGVETRVISEINEFKPDLLFVGFGAPKQEYWIAKNAGRINAKGFMAVGGTFDYISERFSLPPKIFEKFGLEWFWRLLKDPRRIKRIINASLIFPFKVYLYKLGAD